MSVHDECWTCLSLETHEDDSLKSETEWMALPTGQLIRTIVYGPRDALAVSMVFVPFARSAPAAISDFHSRSVPVTRETDENT
jgi:hypothetical protein